VKSPPTPTYFLLVALLFTGIPPVADLLKHGATYFAELLHYRDAAVAAAAAAGAGPLPVAGIMMITHPISSSPCIARGHISTRLSIYTGPLCVARINSAIPLGRAPEGRRRCETPFVIDTLCIDTL